MFSHPLFPCTFFTLNNPGCMDSCTHCTHIECFSKFYRFYLLNIISNGNGSSSLPLEPTAFAQITTTPYLSLPQSQWLLSFHGYHPKICFLHSSLMFKKVNLTLLVSHFLLPWTSLSGFSLPPTSLTLWQHLLSSSFNKLWCVFFSAQMPRSLCLTYSRCSINIS